jgi:zinc/manganese transport system substrate-binding protein
MTNPSSVRLAALAIAVLLVPGFARAAPKRRVACTSPTLEAIAREVGGDRIEAFSLAAGDQDPHFVAPTPSLMKRVRQADMLLEVGMSLEPWTDEVANGSGNPRIFKGAPGRVAVSDGIPKLDVPSIVSRAQGDIHPEGNPHIWLDPVRVKMIADNIEKAFAGLSPQDSAYFQGRAREFKQRLDHALFGDELLRVVGVAKLTRLVLDGNLHAFLESNQLSGKKLSSLSGGWIAKGAPLFGQKVIEFHKVWAYFAKTFGFELVGSIEEKIGVQPGPRHVVATVELAKTRAVRLILVDNFYDPSLANRIASEGGAKTVILPNQVRGEKGIENYFALMDHVLDAMLRSLPKGARP